MDYTKSLPPKTEIPKLPIESQNLEGMVRYERPTESMLKHLHHKQMSRMASEGYHPHPMVELAKEARKRNYEEAFLNKNREKEIEDMFEPVRNVFLDGMLELPDTDYEERISYGYEKALNYIKQVTENVPRGAD